MDLANAIEVDYIGQRDAGALAQQRGRWRVVEDTMPPTVPSKKDPVLSVRRVFVQSTARAHRHRR